MPLKATAIFPHCIAYANKRAFVRLSKAVRGDYEGLLSSFNISVQVVASILTKNICTLPIAISHRS